MKCSEAESKAKQARNAQDLEDELEECKLKLGKTEKALGRYGVPAKDGEGVLNCAL